MATRFTTVIVNETTQGFIMKVGNCQHYFKLASVKLGSEFKMQVDINWTYQEFLIEDKTDSTKKLNVNSDDCCDYERITVREVDGKFDVQRVPRRHYDASAVATTPFTTKKEKSSWRLWL